MCSAWPLRVPGFAWRPTTKTSQMHTMGVTSHHRSRTRRKEGQRVTEGGYLLTPWHYLLSGYHNYAPSC